MPDNTLTATAPSPLRISLMRCVGPLHLSGVIAFLCAAVLAGWALALSVTSASAEPKKFLHQGIERDAARYEDFIKKNWKAGGERPEVLRVQAGRTLGSDPRAASRAYASAVVMEDRNPANWLGLARALLAIKPDPSNTSERYDLPVNASGAAYRAYHLADNSNVQADALFVLAEALQRRAYWRPAITALKSSLNLVEAADVRKAYEELRAQHGFRMMDYATESDVAEPRICVRFSELLSRKVEDFSKYVAVNGKDPEHLVAEKKQLCVGAVTHGERYQIQVRAGLPSDIGEKLTKPLDLAIYVPDRKPFVRFTGRAYVLPSRGQQGIPLVSVNTESVDIQVYRVGDRSLTQQLEQGGITQQLSGYSLDQLKTTSGAEVYTGKMAVASKLNAEVTTAFPVTDVIGTLQPGAYVMTASPTGRPHEHWRNQPTQWFIVSDLGLTAFSGKDGVHGFVRSLAGAEPIGSVTVKLVARNNEILAEQKTDAKGYVHFVDRVTRGEGGLSPAVLVAENANGEYAFLDLRANAFDLSDRGVKGRPAPGPIDGYLYAERGVYRPGEEVNLTGLVRDAAGVAASLPVTMIIQRPDGVEHHRKTLNDGALGGHSHALWLSDGAMTGTWRAQLFIDPKQDAIAQTSFLVEDFQPERIDMTLDANDVRLKPGSGGEIDVSGRYLYGPPAAELSMEGEVIVRLAKSGLAGFKGYQFGLADENITQSRKALTDLAKTGKDGTVKAHVTLPKITKTARPLEAKVLLRLREPGGRTIERSVVVPVDQDKSRIGLKPLFDGNSVDENNDAEFDVVVADAANTQIAQSGLKWQLFKLETSWQWYNSDGQWMYEAQTITRKVGDGQLDVAADKPGRISVPVDYGRYRLVVTSADQREMASSILFNAGWYTSGKTADSPEILDVALDKESFQVGDTAKVRIASRHDGKAMIAVLGHRLHTLKEVSVVKGDNEFDVTVGDDWGPGAYATALMYRAMDEKSKRMPSRSVGIKWIGVDQAPRTLDVSVSALNKIKSGAKLEIPVAISGLSAGEKAHVTVAAVDTGILNVTGYESPQPQAHFYAQRRLAMEIRDLYGRLIDGMRAERGVMRSGGDGGAQMNTAGAPPVEQNVSFFSGIVDVDQDGKANVSFQLPDFNGSVRVMAVAWSRDKLGSSSQTVTVRDAVALTASGPRFLTLGDKAKIQMSVHNVEAPSGEFTMAVSASGDQMRPGAKPEHDALERGVTLDTSERKTETFEIAPDAVGLHTYKVRVTGPGDVDVQRELTFDVKPPSQDIKRTTITTVAENGGTLTLDQNLTADMIASETSINVSVGPLARFDVPALLTALDRYPYGCAEQTISRALPLLYVNEVSKDFGIATETALKGRIQKAIDHVFEMQNASGSFGVWGPGSADIWLTGYVMDFLTRAKEQGFDIKPRSFDLALDRLQNFVVNASDFKSGGESRAYALYVLARNARAPIGELRYYADARIDRFSTPLARAQIGAALAMMGDKTRANQAFASAQAAFDIASGNQSRGDYGSSLRDGAALLTLAAESRVQTVAQPELLDVVDTAYQSRRFTSTQEQAWLLLASHALSQQVKATEIAIDGAPVTGTLQRVIKASDLTKPVTITNNGDQRVDAVVSVIGASMEPQPADARGFKIIRRYYTLDGAEVNLQSANGGTSTLKQNDRLVAVVTIESDEASGNILLADRLPAGLQIENPRLVDGGDVQSLSWLKTPIRPTHTAFRDDRLVAAFNLAQARRRGNQQAATIGEQANAEVATQPKATVSVAYIVRAVTPGTFWHPAAAVEDMYRPERYGRTAAGKLTITGTDEG